MRVVEAIEIERGIEDVWSYVCDLGNDPTWCPKVESVTRLGSKRWLVRHRPIPLRPPAALTVEEVAAEPPQRLVLREEDAASIFDVEYRLERIPSGTRFVQTSDFRFKSLPVLVQRLLAVGVRHDIRGQMRALKRTLEGA